MKYHTRTVVWRFKESSELPLETYNKECVTITTPRDLEANYRSLFADQVRERFVVFWLSSRNNVLGFEIISEGTLNACMVHPREVYRGAIVATCASIIVAHNHPSDSTEPSAEDLQVTKQLLDAGKVVGIPCLDHVIFHGNGITSLAERGIL
jgi:DNA repair protein RadC